MKSYNSYKNFETNNQQSIVTIGSFDGFHLGHKKIIENVVSQAQANNNQSVVLTFFPHPKMILQEKSDFKLINTIDENCSLIAKTNLNNLIIEPFTKEFSTLSAEDFVKKVLVEKLNISKIIVGYDHRFGKNREAGIGDLIQFSEKYNFEVEKISAQELNDNTVSSTQIRAALTNGEVEIANAYLGYTYFFAGKVVLGSQLGRTIGFPTANINIEEGYKLLPKNGVYIVQSTISTKLVFGIMNIGNRPTINGKKGTIEIHFLDFDADLYTKKITVEVLKFIREEQKFDSINDLKNQIEKDKQTAISFFNKK